MSNSFDKADSSSEHGQGPVMVRSPEELKTIILNHDAPFLMACIQKNEIYHEQMEVISWVTKQFKNMLGAFVVSGELMGCFCQKFNVKGTPTFLFFLDGEELDRILGCTSRESLMEFATRNLESINRIT